MKLASTVALIFHLKDVAFQRHRGPNALGHLVCNGGDIGERLVRRDAFGKAAFLHRAVAVGDAATDAGDGGGVQQAQAHAVALKGALGAPLDAVGDGAVGRPGDLGLPGQRDIAQPRAGDVPDDKAPAAHLHAVALDHIGRGAPGTIARRQVDAADHFMRSQANVAQVARLIHQFEPLPAGGLGLILWPTV